MCVGQGGEDVGRIRWRLTFALCICGQDFAWAVATAAYQVEGGWNADGNSRQYSFVSARVCVHVCLSVCLSVFVSDALSVCLYRVYVCKFPFVFL